MDNKQISLDEMSEEERRAFLSGQMAQPRPGAEAGVGDTITPSEPAAGFDQPLQLDFPGGGLRDRLDATLGLNKVRATGYYTPELPKLGKVRFPMDNRGRMYAGGSWHRSQMDAVNALFKNMFGYNANQTAELMRTYYNENKKQ